MCFILSNLLRTGAKQEKNKTQIHAIVTITAQNQPEEINGILKSITANYIKITTKNLV